MLASSTHDTKRSEDVRARLSSLSEIPGEWEAALKEWAELNEQFKTSTCPDRNTEYLIYQTMIGAWPIETDRLLPYLEKATREAKRKTTWLSPNEGFETATKNFVEKLYTHSAFLKSLEAFVARVLTPGRINSLAATLIKLTSPGVPDTYQGMELWDLSLVDPDNRRPVNYETRRNLLAQVKTLSGGADAMKLMDEGMPKLWTIYKALEVRRRFRASFGADGTYKPIFAEGKLRDCVVSYGRADDVVVVVPRLVMKTMDGWHDTTVNLPAGEWTNVLSGEKLKGGKVELGHLLDAFPVALLIKGIDAHV